MVVGEQLHPPSWSCVSGLGADICKTSHETTGWEQDTPRSHSHSDWDSVSEVKFILHTSLRPTEEPLSFVWPQRCGWRSEHSVGSPASAPGKLFARRIYQEWVAGARSSRSIVTGKLSNFVVCIQIEHRRLSIYQRSSYQGAYLRSAKGVLDKVEDFVSVADSDE